MAVVMITHVTDTLKKANTMSQPSKRYKIIIIITWNSCRDAFDGGGSLITGTL